MKGAIWRTAVFPLHEKTRADYWWSLLVSYLSDFSELVVSGGVGWSRWCILTSPASTGLYSATLLDGRWADWGECLLTEPVRGAANPVVESDGVEPQFTGLFDRLLLASQLERGGRRLRYVPSVPLNLFHRRTSGCLQSVGICWWDRQTRSPFPFQREEKCSRMTRLGLRRRPQTSSLFCRGSGRAPARLPGALRGAHLRSPLEKS